MTQSRAAEPKPSNDAGIAPTNVHRALENEVVSILDDCLGLNVFPPPWKRWMRNHLGPDVGPPREGLNVSLCYLLLFVGLPWLASFVMATASPSAAPWTPSWPLFFLQIYGAFWSGWSTMTTRHTSAAVLSTIKAQIIPFLPDDVADHLLAELRRNFHGRRRLLAAWIVGILGSVAAGFFVTLDLTALKTPAPRWEVAFWAFGWFFLYAPATHVVLTSQFYRYFAVALDTGSIELTALDPAHSSLVRSTASVAQRMLLFWFCIAVSIVIVFPFSVKDWSKVFFYIDNIQLNRLLHALLNVDFHHNSFVLLDVIITGFFSIMWGSIIFLRAEASIRQALNSATFRTLRILEIEMRGLQLGRQEDRECLQKLAALHSEAAKAGSYRSLVVSGLSVLITLVIPVVSFLLKGGR